MSRLYQEKIECYRYLGFWIFRVQECSSSPLFFLCVFAAQMEEPETQKTTRKRTLTQEEYDQMIKLLNGEDVTVSSAFKRLSHSFVWKENKLWLAPHT